MSDPLAVRRALVIGLGRSGTAASRALVAAGVGVVAAEEQEEVATAAELPDEVEVRVGGSAVDAEGLLADVDVVVPSPGVPESSPLLRRALAEGIEVWSEPELGWRLAPHRVVGITGTNGKTTVTELVTAMLTSSGVAAVACGNIGTPFTDAAATAPEDTILVAELSSFQLRFCHRLRPEVGVLVNLAPDHLDWHADEAAYAAAKARLWAAQEPSDWAVGNRDDPRASELVRAYAPGRIGWATVEGVPDVGVGIDGGHLVANLGPHRGRILALDDLAVGAPHQISNLAVAAAAALAAAATVDGVAGAARGFRPGRHRLEVVAVSDGVTWIDDSKATNPHAAAAALRAAGQGPGRTVWIAGGLAKGLDLSGLGAELDRVRVAVLIGEAAPQLARVAEGAGVEAVRAASIEEAVEFAADSARPGDTVVLAPACASFDQFRDYAERGDRFTAAVRARTGREGGRGRGIA